jgi:hypothetical protein
VLVVAIAVSGMHAAAGYIYVAFQERTAEN